MSEKPLKFLERISKGLGKLVAQLILIFLFWIIYHFSEIGQALNLPENLSNLTFAQIFYIFILLDVGISILKPTKYDEE